MIKFAVVGAILGILFFILFENSVSNSFLSTCWIRQQPKLFVHNKVYILGGILVYRGIVDNDPIIVTLGASWIGLHVSQDIAERIHENRKMKM